MAKCLRIVVASILSIGVVLLLAEMMLRIFLLLVPCPSDSPYVPDKHAGFRLRPTPLERIEPDSEDYINQFGFRDCSHPVQKPPQTYRLLGIGDSFVYGVVPPRENFLKIAARRLDPALEPQSLKSEMILMGLGSYSLRNELGLMRSFGLRLKPDLVILNFFVGNDVSGLSVRAKVYMGQRYFEGSYYPLLNLLRKSRLFLLSEKVFLTRIKAAILKHRLETPQPEEVEPTIPIAPMTPFSEEGEISTGEGRPQDRENRVSVDMAHEVGSLQHSPEPSIVTQSYLHIQKKRLVVYRREHCHRLERLWAEAERYLEEFDLTCREAGIPWILHMIPAEIQVNQSVRAVVLDRLGLSEEDYDFDSPQRRLRQFAEQRGIACWCPLADLRKASHPESRLYVPKDTHWGRRGNEVAGVLLAQFIKSEMLRGSDSER